MADQQILSKGFYQYSQFNHFVSVKNYIFIRQNGKKCLLIRFSNDADFFVERLCFTVVQMDAAGKVLGRSVVEMDGLHMRPGQMYAPANGIIVPEACNDFKIQYDEVGSGQYSYRIAEGGVVASYVCPQKPLLPYGKKKNARRAVEEYTVSTKRYVKPKSALALAIVAVLISLLLVVGNLFFVYASEEGLIEDWLEDPMESVFGISAGASLAHGNALQTDACTHADGTL